jgi:hypothetical protein
MRAENFPERFGALGAQKETAKARCREDDAKQITLILLRAVLRALRDFAASSTSGAPPARIR